MDKTLSVEVTFKLSDRQEPIRENLDKECSKEESSPVPRPGSKTRVSMSSEHEAGPRVVIQWEKWSRWEVSSGREAGSPAQTGFGRLWEGVWLLF